MFTNKRCSLTEVSLYISRILSQKADGRALAAPLYSTPMFVPLRDSSNERIILFEFSYLYFCVSV